MPLAGQLTHQSYVRPGPLVLGTAFLNSLSAAEDRDRTVEGCSFISVLPTPLRYCLIYMKDLGNYKGRHYSEWMKDVEKLIERGKSDKAIELLYELIAVVETEARTEKWIPAPAYYACLAQLYRERKDYLQEYSVIDRLVEKSIAYGGMRANTEYYVWRRAARELILDPPVLIEPPACPACGLILDEMIKRPRKCKGCGVRMVVRWRDDVPYIRTEEEAKEADTLEETLVRANSIGIDDKTFFDRGVELKEKHGVVPTAGDVFWGLANERQAELTKAADRATSADVARQMAFHLVSEGRDWVPLVKDAVRHEIAVLRQSNKPSSIVSVAGCECSACSETSQPMSLADATTSPPIPHTECAKPPCPCFFLIRR